MRLTFIIFLLLAFNSCNSDTKEIDTRNNIERPELSMDSKIFLGNRLFSEKTCITCHAIDHKKVGPSVISIMNIYKAQNGDIVSFLKGKSKPIVDTDKKQIAIMQANIDGFLKQITDEELNAIATYMMHVTDLNAK